MSALVGRVPRGAVDAKLISLLSGVAVGFGVLLSGFVIEEPAPYEIYMAGLIAVWFLFGLKISRGVAPLLMMLAIFNVGGMLAMTQMTNLYSTPLYLAVSLFLGLTAVFIAAIIEAQPELYRVIFGAWLLAALVTASLGIAGYFNAFPGADAFTKFSRAAGAFQDPNVFGPFLALPGIYMLHRLVTGHPLQMPLFAAALIVIAGGIFLSFSRGAWGLFSVSAILMLGVQFLRSESAAFRFRIVAMSLTAVAILAVALLIALQIPVVAELFSSRAQLVQEYDGSRLGRFARYGIGFALATERPLGIGALNFGRIYAEDTHNIWLKALMDYGWLGFVAWTAMIVWTIAGGFRILFRERPWQPYLLCAYVVFLGHIALGTVIDMDHWRHFYLLIGLIWGSMALEMRRTADAKPDYGPRREAGAVVGATGFEPATP